MLFSAVKSVPTVTKFCSSSSNFVVPQLVYPSFLRLHLSKNLQQTLVVDSRGVSSFRASVSSSSSVPPTKEKTRPSPFDAAISSLVQVFYIESNPKPLQPWEMSDPEEKRLCYGYVVSGRKILTDSFIDNHCSCLRVKKYGSATFYEAKFEASSSECGLATLVVESEEFWEHIHPLELGDDIPSIGETVSVLSYDSYSFQLNECTVSSVEPRGFSYITVKLLSIQIVDDDCFADGMVFMGNKVIGIHRRGVISAPVIKHFLSGSEERDWGFGFLDICWQSMEDAQLRRHFKMNLDMTGVLVVKIFPLSAALNVLKEYDVLLAIENYPIDNLGRVHFQQKIWLDFDRLVSMKKPGETVLVKILRDGKEHAFSVSLNFTYQPLVPFHFLPSYYILAGFVFIPLTYPYTKKSSTISTCVSKRIPTKAGEQIVILSQVLSDDLNRGYSDLKDLEVKKVNGIEVVNLKHLRNLVEKCHTEDIRLDLEEGYVIVLNNKAAKEITPLILQRYGIPSAMSNDLQNTNSGQKDQNNGYNFRMYLN